MFTVFNMDGIISEFSGDKNEVAAYIRNLYQKFGQDYAEDTYCVLSESGAEICPSEFVSWAEETD